MMEFIEQIRAIVGEKGVLTGDDVRSRPSTYWNHQPMQAAAIVRPASVAEVSACMRQCHEHGITVVPLGGNTGLVEGTACEPDQIMLSLERMNTIEQVDEVSRTVVVQAGTILQTVQAKVSEHQLMLPVDLGARGSCTIGGMIATNAGGFGVLRYGMMRERVLGLEAVLADGTVVSSMNGYLKNNTGYDLKQLFIGSEGTLGVVTRAVLRLEEHQTAETTALIALHSYSQVTQLLKHLDRALSGSLSAFEVMWGDFFALNTGEHSKLESPFAASYPFYVLVECQGNQADELRQRFELALEHAFENALLEDAVIAQSAGERASLWAIREISEPEERFFEITIGFDVSLSIADMDSYVSKVQGGLAQLASDATLLVFGHLADGNLHLTVGLHTPVDREAIEHLIYEGLKEYGGAISAEHGVGLEKKAYLAISRQPAELALMRQIKATLDPQNRLNPGKIFD
ncbi:FAD-binding oxidoreductase [Marinobacter sp. DY40_1A1]|uniref:FAD-binding oxidoreductase n=1 Tax=Marinobacter sp. DY40_1A1 TaxID=2583229 RepID=UPI0019048A4B|nr:FAD-binding oxidoreductase [Marinobacter sp. DY40_1A1]MBK1885633.1 FAD-binding oxidoreductase [Marinobacter sp. DY40_1A1]